MGTPLDGLDEVEAAAVRVGRLVEEKVEESRVLAAMKGGTEQVVGMQGDHDVPAPGRDHESRADRPAQRTGGMASTWHRSAATFTVCLPAPVKAPARCSPSGGNAWPHLVRAPGSHATRHRRLPQEDGRALVTGVWPPVPSSPPSFADGTGIEIAPEDPSR